MPRRPTGNPAGRPAHGPIELRPPKFLPLDEEQREAAIKILVELLDDWLARRKSNKKVAV